MALVGIVAPMALGFGVGRVLLPGEPWMVHAFLGAMLAATSVGITARVLQDAQAIRTPSARIILGAAVIDDVLGLVVLAIIAGVIEAAAQGESLAAGGSRIVAKALGSWSARSRSAPSCRRASSQGRPALDRGVVLALALAFCFGLAWLAGLAGLAPIVGAFAAGLVLEDVHFDGTRSAASSRSTRASTRSAGSWCPCSSCGWGCWSTSARSCARVLGFALALTLAAMIGKWACGLVDAARRLRRHGRDRHDAARRSRPDLRGHRRDPRAGGHPVVGPDTYAAAVFMVVVTTMATPPLLLWSLRRDAASLRPTG